MAATAPRPRLTAVVHDVRSLHNVGAIFRTADGAGFDDVLLAGYTGCPPDPRIAKVALGAEEALPWLHIAKLDDLLAHLASAHVIVLEQHQRSTSPADLRLPESDNDWVALIACGELYGAPPALLERANQVLELPMRGSKQSLNVSIAFGIAAYAVADLAHPVGPPSREPRDVRPGVLTNGVTTGETPDRLRPRP